MPRSRQAARPLPHRGRAAWRKRAGRCTLSASANRSARGVDIYTSIFCEAVERGLTDVKLVISDAHVGLTKAIQRMFQGYCWQRCRVHFARNLLQRVPNAHQRMVTAALRSVFSQEDAVGLVERWDDLANSLAERFPKAAELMKESKEDVLAFRHFPQPHWK